MAKLPTHKNVISDLLKIADKERAVSVSKYFKTGKGEYGEGDVFIGITVPEMRKVAKQYADLSMTEIKKLLSSKIHEHRFVALIILCLQYDKVPEKRKEVFETYIENTKYINNWDLVDVSSRDIVGHYIWNYYSASKRKTFLTKLARSKHLWERRIAIVSTSYGISIGKFDETFLVSNLLLKDTHDLMHKATGWMLREVGKRDRKRLEDFLIKKAHIMPRTMLRYSLEHFVGENKAKYMKMRALSLKA